MEMYDGDGGYDVCPVIEAPSELFCMICMKLMKEPVQFTCGHGMCSSCYKNLKRSCQLNFKEVKCPQCRAEITDYLVVTNVMLNRLILSLKVKCSNVDIGCSWTSDLSNMKDHLCEYAKINCLNKHCNAKIERRLLHQHLPECNAKVTNENCVSIRELTNKLNDQNMEINSLKNQLSNDRTKNKRLEQEIKSMKQRLSDIERSLMRSKHAIKQQPQQLDYNEIFRRLQEYQANSCGQTQHLSKPDTNRGNSCCDVISMPTSTHIRKEDYQSVASEQFSYSDFQNQSQTFYPPAPGYNQSSLDDLFLLNNFSN